MLYFVVIMQLWLLTTQYIVSSLNFLLFLRRYLEDYFHETSSEKNDNE